MRLYTLKTLVINIKNGALNQIITQLAIFQKNVPFRNSFELSRIKQG